MPLFEVSNLLSRHVQRVKHQLGSAQVDKCLLLTFNVSPIRLGGVHRRLRGPAQPGRRFAVNARQSVGFGL